MIIALLQNIGHDVVAITKTDAPYANAVLDLKIPVKKITNNWGHQDIFAVKK